jgi:crotonobetainyl-CoA:carnitine CoA-transferase CaiB-like acyl-CoA transferase
VSLPGEEGAEGPVPGPLDGIRVIEVASWMFIPSCGSVLVDWGADVVKVEHPVTGDPQRGLVTAGLLPGGAGAVNFMMEQPNRGKRSVALDLSHPDGREALLTLVETADVFLTNYMPPVRRKLGIDTDDLRARNPRIIVARGTGAGPKGPEAEKGGYDGASFWARGGVGATMPEREGGWPPGQPTPAFGDVMAGLATAGAIAAALVKRDRTGEPSVVDVSLLATAMWQVSPMVIASKLFGFSKIPQGDRTKSPNPAVGTYRTADDRFISLILLQSDRHWADLVERLGVPDMATDPRFADATVRSENAEACIARLDEAFGGQPLAHWRKVLDTFEGVWSPFQTLDELYDDVQVQANGYLPTMAAGNGQEVALVASPAQFDEEPVRVERAPEHGEHTEQVLLDAGYGWDRIAALKESGAIL